MLLCLLSHYVLKLQRYDIVNGVVEVDGLKDEAATNQTDVDSKEGNIFTIWSYLIFYLCFLSLIIINDFSEKGVPDFWLTAMKTNEILAEEVETL